MIHCISRATIWLSHQKRFYVFQLHILWGCFVVIALVMSTSCRKNFSSCNLWKKCQQSTMFTSRWSNEKKTHTQYSISQLYIIRIWTARSKCAFTNVSSLFGALADSHIQTLSVDIWIMNSRKKTSTNFPREIVFAILIFGLNRDRFADILKTVKLIHIAENILWFAYYAHNYPMGNFMNVIIKF